MASTIHTTRKFWGKNYNKNFTYFRFLTVLCLSLLVSPFGVAHATTPVVPQNELITRLQEENDKIVSQLQQISANVPELQNQVNEATKLLTETQQLLPQVQAENAEAKKAADDAKEVYVVRENVATQVRKEVATLTEKVSQLEKETSEMQTLVSSVARDMYITGTRNTPAEIGVVLSKDGLTEATTQIENSQTLADTTGNKLNAHVAKQSELEESLTELSKKKLELEQAESAAVAQKVLAEDNANAVAEKEQLLKKLIEERAVILAATQQMLNEGVAQKEMLQNASSQLSAQLLAEKVNLNKWLEATRTPTGVRMTEAPPGACPKTFPAGTNRSNLDLYSVCVEAVKNAPTPEAQKAILYAFNHLGAPYSQSNRLSVDPPVFDCSSFVARAYSAGGAYVAKRNGTVSSWLSMFGSTVRYIPQVYNDTNLLRVPSGVPLLPGDIFIQFNGGDPGSSAGNAGHAQMYLGIVGGKKIIIQSGGGGDSRVNVSEYYNGLSNEWVFRYTRG